MKQQYIHYGDKEFKEKLFMPINNKDFFVKPLGGLWASRDNARYGWIKWCKDEKFNLNKYSENNYFKFRLKDNSKVLIISNRNQLKKLPQINMKEKFGFNLSWTTLDFSKIAEEYDAMEVLISEDRQLYWDLYGWDCDSLLVFNKDCIECI